MLPETKSRETKLTGFPRDQLFSTTRTFASGKTNYPSGGKQTLNIKSSNIS